MEEKKNGERKGGKYSEKKNMFLAKEKKTLEGKGGKYLQKENIFFCGGEEERGSKTLTYFPPFTKRGKIGFCGGDEERRSKRRKIFGERKCRHGRTTNKQTRKHRATLPMDYGRLR